MNFALSHLHRAGRQTGAMLLIVWLACSLSAQTPGARTNSPPKPVAERFLLIVETSAAMQKRAANVEQVVGNLFRAGLGNQLHGGDTIGVWTYNENLQTGQFPLQRWTPQTGTAVANGIVFFLKARKYEKTSRLAPVMAQLTNVVADSAKLTVLLVSDGDDALTGTPYDAQIAAAYRLNAAEQRKNKMPFLTILRTMNGKFIGFSVNTPPWPVEFPKFPVQPKPAAVVATVPEVKPESPPVSKSEPKLNLSPEPKPEPKGEVTPQPQIELAPVLPVTNPPPGAGVSAPIIATPVIPARAPTSTPPAQLPPVSNSTPVLTPKTNRVVQPSAAGTSTGGKSLLLTLLVAGSGLLIGIVVTGVWLLRSRSKPRASLITRSIDRAPK